MAPAVTGRIVCSASDAGTPSKLFYVSVESRLAETVSYIDQGFASFNRERMDVPLASGTYAKLIAQAMQSALLARGYNVELVAPGDVRATRFALKAAPVPGEQFEGLALLTKIGLLGLTQRSFAFCSFEVAGGFPNSNTLQVIGNVNTREDLPAIYSGWQKDMANGPSPQVHTDVSALLEKTLERDVRAAVHAIPSNSLNKLFSQQSD